MLAMKASTRSIRVLAVLLALLVAVASSAVHSQTPAALPTPEKFFGFQMGADRKLANWDKLHELLPAAREGVRSRQAGGAWQVERGPAVYRSLHLVARQPRTARATAPDNAKLADPRGIPEAEVKKLVADGKAVTIQSFALHSSEVAASQTAAEFVYDSLSRTDEEAMRNLDQVVSIVLPSINPDGTQMIADWYMKYVGTDHEASSLPWLYQKYSGHDNNRDGFALNLPESQHIGKLMYRDWLPQAYMDHHQMGSGNARLFIPPYAEPIRPDGDPLVWREITWFGGHMGTKLEAAGKTGVIGAAIYSGWGHMGFHWITPFHNIAGMLNESASARLATPLFQHPDQLRGGTRGLPEYASQTTMPSLWPGGRWRVRDIVENQKIVAWSIVDLAARNRETLLSNMYLKTSRQSERGLTQPVKAYAIAADQHDRQTVKKLANMLMDSGVEVHQTKGQLIVEGRVYGPGSFIVSMAQPKQGLVRWMLGRTFYPDNTYTRDLEGNPIRPYDMSTDTFGEFMGVRSDPIGEKIAGDLIKLTAKVPMTGTVAASAPNGYVLDGRLNDSFRAAFLLLDKGIAVRRASQPSSDGSVRTGDFLVAIGDVAAIAQQTGVDFVALKSPLSTGAYPLRKPRIAMLQRYGGGNMDEGWTRLMFEQFNVTSKPIMDAEIKAGGLESKYNTIVLPADSIAAMTGERPPQGQGAGGGGGGGFGGGPDNTPAEFRSGFGAEGVKALQAFVQKGGTLLTFASAGDLPIQRFGLPVRNVVNGLPSKTFWSPGSTLRVTFNNSNPLAYGMPNEGLALFMAGGQVYEIVGQERSQDVEILTTYAERDILQSGWLLGEQVIARKAAAVSVKHGAGKVVMIGYRPQHRDQTHGTFKMVFNALLNGPPAAPTSTTTVQQED